MKRLMFAILLIPIMVSAEVNHRSVTVTANSQNVAVSGRSVLLVNDEGSSTAYFRLFSSNDTAAAATTSSAKIKSGESLSFSQPQSSTVGYSSISLIAAAGTSATVRIYSE